MGVVGLVWFYGGFFFLRCTRRRGWEDEDSAFKVVEI